MSFKVYKVWCTSVDILLVLSEWLKGERAVGLWECELVRVSVLREMKERNEKLKGERAVGVIWNDI